MNRQIHEPDQFTRRTSRHAPDTEPEGIELGVLVGALRRGKWIILVCTLVAGSIAWAVLRTVQPSYYSYVEVLLNTRQERIVGVEQVVSDLNVTNSVVAGEIAVLRSNLLLGKVVDDLDLMHHPEFDPYSIAEPSLPARMVDRVRGWLALAGPGRTVLEPLSDVTADSEQDAVGGLSPADARNIVIWQVRRNLSVYQSGISYVISISMQAHDPDIAAAIANAVAEGYIRDQLDTKLAATQRAIAWLDNRLIDLAAQLSDAEDAVVEFLAQQVMEEGGDKESVAQQLVEMNRSIVDARSESAAASARLNYIRGLIAEDGEEAAAAVLLTPRLASLDAELADLTRQQAQLATRLGPQHPQMLALQLAVDDVMRDRLAAVRSAVGDLAATVAQADARESAIRSDIVTAQLLQVELSRSSVRLSQLERSASAMRQVYESFLARFQETTQQLEFQRPDARIVTAGVRALTPTSPRRGLIMAVALVLGAILGLVIVLVRAALDRSVGTAAELQKLTGRTVLVTLPRVRFRGANWQRALLNRTRISGYAEGLRLLRFSLMNIPGDTESRVVMLTGAGWRVGNSTTVMGLARALAAIGQKVTIIDANFHRPAQARMLGVTKTGASIDDYLVGTVPLDAVVLADVEPRLSLVPARSGTTNAADMLSSENFARMIEVLSRTCDFVLIDAPPATGLADTAVLARLTDAVVVVVRSRRTRTTAVTDAIAMIEDAGGNVLGCVLSQTETRTDASSATSPKSARPRETGRNAYV